MAMARDGLLPSFFSDVNQRTQVPVKSTIVTGICAACLAFFMDVSQLAGMVSVGTLLAFTIVAVSILILRYAPPDEVPLPSSLEASFRLSQEYDEEKVRGPPVDANHEQLSSVVESINDTLIEKKQDTSVEESKRRKAAVCSISSVGVGVVVLTTSASFTFLPL
jgi:cationic amino acid transporter 1